MRIGILNGGGDCAGLNSVTRAVLKAAEIENDSVVGIVGGWGGLMGGKFRPINYHDFEHLIGTGGTLLETSRVNPLKSKEGMEVVEAKLKGENIDVLIAVGGDDTLGVASALAQRGIKVVGVPKTIDNDLAGTDYSFGFFSAVDEATRMLESLAATGRSHNRVMVVEVMGRDAGWITAFAGTAAGANAILIPEFKTDLAELARIVRSRYDSGNRSALIVVAEGVNLGDRGTIRMDEFGHPILSNEKFSNAEILARYIEEKTGCETRATVLGHTIRGTAPNAYDRVMTTMLGLKAMEAVHAGRYGVMVAIRGTRIVEVPLAEGVKKKFVDRETWDAISKFFG